MLFGCIRAPVTETEVVFRAAALVTVTFDGEPYICITLQPGCIALECGNLVGPYIGLVEIKVDFLYVLPEQLVDAHVRRPRRRRRRCRRRRRNVHSDSGRVGGCATRARGGRLGRYCRRRGLGSGPYGT